MRAFAPTRLTMACGRAGPIDDAVALTSALAERVGADEEILRQAACPVLVVAAAPRAADHVAAQSRR